MQTLTFTNRLRNLWGGQGTLRQHLAQAAAGSAALALSSKLLMLLTSVLLARWMGVQGYGVYATVMALVLLLTVPTGLGLPTLVVRLLASYRVHQQWGLMRGLLVRGNQAVLGASLVIALIAGAVIWGLGDWLGLTHTGIYILALVLIPLTALGAMRSAALRGLHHVVLGQLPENLVMPGLFVALLAAWSATGSALSPQAAVGLRLGAVSVAFGVGAWLLLRRLPSQVRQATPRYDMANWARAAGPLLFLGGMSIINTQTDVLMLAAMQGAEAAGIYQAAARGAELVAFSLVVVNMAIQSTISRLYAAGEMQRLQRVITTAARVTVALALPAALMLSLFARPILGLVFGSEFERGALCLVILCGAQVVNAGAGSVGLILKMTGHERDAALGMAFGAFTNVVLNTALVPVWGIDGAALATGMSLIVWNVFLVARVWKRLSLDSTALGTMALPRLKSRRK